MERAEPGGPDVRVVAEGEHHPRAAAVRMLGDDAAAVGFGDLPDDGEAEAYPGNPRAARAR